MSLDTQNAALSFPTALGDTVLSHGRAALWMSRRDDGMKMIPLKGKRGLGRFAVIDDQDLADVSRHSWFVNKDGYAYTTTQRNYAVSWISMHRMILNPVAGFATDHVNGNKLDNRRCNLRAVTCSENQSNRQGRIQLRGRWPRGVGKTSGSQTNPFCAYAKKNGKRIHGGSFATVEEATERAIQMRRELGYIDSQERSKPDHA